MKNDTTFVRMRIGGLRGANATMLKKGTSLRRISAFNESQ